MTPIRAYKPFELVTSDILGPLPTSKNKYILVISDHFSKWVELYAMPDQEAIVAGNIAKFVCQHGVPEKLLTDQEKNYESLLISE